MLHTFITHEMFWLVHLKLYDRPISRRHSALYLSFEEGNTYPAVAPSAVYPPRPEALTSGYLVRRRTSPGLYETISQSPDVGSIPSPAIIK